MLKVLQISNQKWTVDLLVFYGLVRSLFCYFWTNCNHNWLPNLEIQKKKQKKAACACHYFYSYFLRLTYSQLKELLPDSYVTLSYLVEALPNCNISPVYPFSGFVLNNVSTCIHRDWGDEDICLVLVLSNCLESKLCLLEPGVVLKLNSGDIVIF